MTGRECYHCKQWVEEGEAHDCWTTTESALTTDLSEDLREAWDRLRETAAGFGEQRIYASHNSIMFSRKASYFFVRPKKSHLEVWVFLPRAIKAPQVRKAEATSKTKFGNQIQIRHRDEVEAPITDWLREAYDFASAAPPVKSAATKQAAAKKKSGTKKRARSGRSSDRPGAKATVRARGRARAARPRR